MKASHRLWNMVFLVLAWALGILFFLFLAAIFAGMGNIIAADMLDPFQWIAFLWLVVNFVASVLGLICLFATSIVTEARLTWLLSFIFAAVFGANVIIAPLFRHYVINKQAFA